MIKWIGQHIVDFIARFRSDVYLEDIADGTVVDNKFLGLDSNNKIVKEAASTTVTDLHTAGVDGADGQVLTDKGDGTIDSEAYLTVGNTVSSSKMEFISPANQADKFQINTTTNGATTLTTIDDDAAVAHFEIAADGNITLDAAGDIALEAAGNDITVDTDSFTIESAGNHFPGFTLKSTFDGVDGANFYFSKDRGAAAVNDDVLGTIWFKGENDAEQNINYGNIQTTALEVDDTDEAGRMSFSVAESDGSTSHLTAGLVIEGSDNATDGEVNVTIGAGAASTTTIAGGFSAQGTLTYDSETLTVGAADAGDASIQRTATSSGSGGNLKVNGAAASGADRIGGVLYLQGGQSNGAATGGSIYIQGSLPGSSGSSLNSLSATSRFDFKVGNTSSYGTTPSAGRGWQQTIDINTNTFEGVYTAGDAVPGYKLKYAPAGTQSSLGVGEIYYLHTDGSWIQADASATSTGATQLLAVIGNGGALPAKGCFIEGMIRIPAASILNTPGSGAVDGLPVYVSTTAGHFDFTAPSGNDEYVRCVGYALDDDTGATGDVLVWFKPDNTFVKITA